MLVYQRVDDGQGIIVNIVQLCQIMGRLIIVHQISEYMFVSDKAPWRCTYYTIWIHLVMTNSLPWKITMLLIGKASISIRAIEKPWLC